MKKQVVHIFTFLCISATISMIVYWSNEYFKDNDLSFVDYKLTKDAEQPYPTFSLCFKNPFLNEELKRIHPILNSSLYYLYLKGEINDKEAFYNNGGVVADVARD